MSRHFELMQGTDKRKAFRSDEHLDSGFVQESDGNDQDHADTATKESMFGLVQRIFLQQSKIAPRMVVVAGIGHGCGCSQIAASLAESLAANASRGVCLVEGDLRSPRGAVLIGATLSTGLMGALQQREPIQSYLKATKNELLWLLEAGPASAGSASLLNSAAMKSRCAELRKEFDFVIMDAPPVNLHPDATALAQLSDGVVLVLEAETTRREAALTVVENLKNLQIPILGAVLNKRVYPIPERIYRKL